MNTGKSILTPPRALAEMPQRPTRIPYKDAGAPAPQEGGAAPAAPQVNDEPAYTGYDGIINMLHNEADSIKVMSPEEREAERKRAERSSMIGGIADAASALTQLIAAHNYAPYVAPQGPSMSERAAARYQRILQMDEGNRGRRLDLLLRAAGLQGERDKMRYNMRRDKEARERDERNFKYQQGRDQAADQRWQQQYEDSRSDRREDLAYRQRAFEHQQQNDRAQLAQGWSRISIDREQHAPSYKFTLGDDRGMIEVPHSAINSQTVGALHALVPEALKAKPQVRENAYGSYEVAPSIEEQLTAIGKAVGAEEATELRNALRRLVGRQDFEGTSTSENDMTPPSMRGK